MRGHRDSHLGPRKQALARHHISWQLDLGLPASGTMRNKLLLLTSPPSLSLLQQLEWTKSHPQLKRQTRTRHARLSATYHKGALRLSCSRPRACATCPQHPNSLSHSCSGTGQGPVGSSRPAAQLTWSRPRKCSVYYEDAGPAVAPAPCLGECLLSIQTLGTPGACVEASAGWRGPTRWAAPSLSSGTGPPSGQTRGVGLSADIREVRSSHASSSLSEAMNVNMALPLDAPARRGTGDLVPLPCVAKAAGG